MARFCHMSYRIPFSETDAMGIVHHSNHARYLERGRVELLRLIGLGYGEVVKRGLHLPLTGLEISFKRPLVFDDIILLETCVSRVTRTRMSLEYRIFTGAALALPLLSEEPYSAPIAVVGETHHCCVNEKGRPVEMPADVFEKLSSLVQK